MRRMTSVLLWLGALGWVVGACRGEPTRQPGPPGPLGAGGAPDDGGSPVVLSAGFGGAGVCEDVREGRFGNVNGCLNCRELPCEPGETCSAGAHYNGPLLSYCLCTDGFFACRVEPYPMEQIGGMGGSGVSPAQGGQDSGVVDASADAMDASTQEGESAAPDGSVESEL
jgi:hypothetical protein